MSQDGVFAVSLSADKYTFLKAAASGRFGEMPFWFSKPYEDVISRYDTEKWDKVLSILDQEIPAGKEE